MEQSSCPGYISESVGFDSVFLQFVCIHLFIQQFCTAVLRIPVDLILLTLITSLPSYSHLRAEEAEGQ